MNTTVPAGGLPSKRVESLPGEHVLRRISWLTLAFGFAVASLAAAMHRVDWAGGLASGAVLGWLNFRWLRRGVKTMIRSVTHAADLGQIPELPETAEPKRNTRVSDISAVLLMLFRYALLGLGVYVIFTYLHVPLASIALGLCALGVAIMTASVWEIVHPAK